MSTHKIITAAQLDSTNTVGGRRVVTAHHRGTWVVVEFDQPDEDGDIAHVYRRTDPIAVDVAAVEVDPPVQECPGCGAMFTWVTRKDFLGWDLPDHAGDGGGYGGRCSGLAWSIIDD